MIILTQDDATKHVKRLRKIATSFLSMARSGFVTDKGEITMKRGLDHFRLSRDGSVTHTTTPATWGWNQITDFHNLPRRGSVESGAEVALAMAEDLSKRIGLLQGPFHRDGVDMNPVSPVITAMRLAISNDGRPCDEGYVEMPFRGSATKAYVFHGSKAWSIPKSLSERIVGRIDDHESMDVSDTDSNLSVSFNQVHIPFATTMDMTETMRIMQKHVLLPQETVLERMVLR